MGSTSRIGHRGGLGGGRCRRGRSSVPAPPWPADAATFAASALLIQFGVRSRPATAAAAGAERPREPAAAAEGGHPAGLRRPGAAHAAGTRLAGGLLRGARGPGRPVRGAARGRGGRGGPAHRRLAARRGRVDPVVHPEDRPADPAALDGADGGARLRNPRGAVASPGPDRARWHCSRCPTAFTMYQIAANTAFVERIPNEKRGQAFGLANAGLVVGQGVAFAIAGAAAEVVPPSTVVALSGGIGAVIACWPGAPLAGNVTRRRPSHCEASWPRGLAYQAKAPIPSGSL